MKPCTIRLWRCLHSGGWWMVDGASRSGGGDRVYDLGGVIVINRLIAGGDMLSMWLPISSPGIFGGIKA